MPLPPFISFSSSSSSALSSKSELSGKNNWKKKYKLITRRNQNYAYVEFYDTSYKNKWARVNTGVTTKKGIVNFFTCGS